MSLRLRILSQLFYPELISTGQTMTELGEALQLAGIEVSVYCGYPTLQDRSKVPKRLCHEGIVVQRLWGTQFPKLNFLGKLINHLTFSFSVLLKLFFDREKTPVLVTTNPPMLPVLCAFVCVLKRRPYIYLVFDVYPETAVKAGVLSPKGLLTRVWTLLQRFALQHATQVVVIGRCMKALIVPYLKDEARLVHIPVWADDKRIHRQRDDSPFVSVAYSGGGAPEKTVLRSAKLSEKVRFQRAPALCIPLKHLGRRKRLDLFPWSNQEKIVVGYSGNMARFHDIETLLAAAETLRDDSRFLFVFVGDGYKRGLVAEAARRLPNIRLEAYVPREKLGDLLASFSIGVVSLLPGHEGLSVPSKTYGLLAAGCPVLGVLPETSEIALMLQESQSGCVIAPGDVSGVVAALQDRAENPDRWETWGKNGRVVSETQYSLKQVAAAYKVLLEKMN